MSSADLHDIECQRVPNLPCICRSLSNARLDTYLNERASLRSKVESLRKNSAFSAVYDEAIADVLTLFDRSSK